MAGPVREVLRAAAALPGVDFAVSDLAIVLGRGVADLVPAVDEACAADVTADAGPASRAGLAGIAARPLHELTVDTLRPAVSIVPTAGECTVLLLVYSYMARGAAVKKCA